MTIIRDSVQHPEFTGAKTGADVDEWNELARAMGEPEQIITEQDRQSDTKARRAIQEYILNDNGISYQSQGYALPDGQVPYTKTLEHLIISDTLARERNVKHGRN